MFEVLWVRGCLYPANVPVTHSTAKYTSDIHSSGSYPVGTHRSISHRFNALFRHSELCIFYIPEIFLYNTWKSDVQEDSVCFIDVTVSVAFSCCVLTPYRKHKKSTLKQISTCYARCGVAQVS